MVARCRATSFWNIWDFANDAPHEQYAQFNPKNGVPTSNCKMTAWDIYLVLLSQDDYKIRPNLTINLGFAVRILRRNVLQGRQSQHRAVWHRALRF